MSQEEEAEEEDDDDDILMLTPLHFLYWFYSLISKNQ